LCYSQGLGGFAEMKLSSQFAKIHEVAKFKPVLILTRHHKEVKKYFKAWQESATILKDSHCFSA
jgi:hypothetical protein